MGIEQICKTIENYFQRVRPPFPELPTLPLVCAALKRPGLSTIQSTSNIVKELNKLGIPTGPMPDGSPNLTVAFAYAAVNEIFRALKFDASIQGGVFPASLMIQAGPYPGTNTMPGRVKVVIG